VIVNANSCHLKGACARAHATAHATLPRTLRYHACYFTHDIHTSTSAEHSQTPALTATAARQQPTVSYCNRKPRTCCCWTANTVHTQPFTPGNFNSKTFEAVLYDHEGIRMEECR